MGGGRGEKRRKGNVIGIMLNVAFLVTAKQEKATCRLIDYDKVFVPCRDDARIMMVRGLSLLHANRTEGAVKQISLHP